MPQRFLDPDVLMAISGLELVARTVVDGFVAGLHRSPDFGFSQEFAEYRAYTPGDDLRHVDWNVFARTERAYLKRYRGETNSLLTVLLDASQSMEYASHPVSKMDYARYIAASLFYLAIHSQRDAAGLIVFDDEVRNYIRPSTRQGQLARLIHVLDPEEIAPTFRDAAVLVDLETSQQMEVTPDYAQREYRGKMNAHIADLRARSRGAGLDYFLLPTDRPLDAALREYLTIRHKKN